MQLHRAIGRPDWAGKTASQRNGWQRLAVATGGVLTPGNIITLVGLAAVVYGLVLLSHHHYWAGLVLLTSGRLCDLLDGFVAERTATKSPLGEALDVIADKVGLLGSVAVFFTLHLAPAWLLVVMFLPHLIITILGVPVYLGKRPLHPSQIGKYATAGVWIVTAGYVAAQAFGQAGRGLVTTIDVLAVLVAAAGFYAAYEYAHGRD